MNKSSNKRPKIICNCPETFEDPKVYDEMLQLLQDTNKRQYIFWKDINSVYRGCNKKFAKLIGLKNPKDVVGKTDYDFAWKNTEAKHFIELDKKVMESNKSRYNVVQMIHYSDTDYSWVETSKIPLHDKNGKVVGVLGVDEDITDRINAEQELKEKEKRFRTLFEGAPDAVFVAGMDGFIVDVNSAATKLMKMRKKDLIGIHQSKLHPSELSEETRRVFKDHIKQIQSGRVAKTMDLPVLCSDGTQKIVGIRARKFKMGGKNYIHGVFRDVTKKKTMEISLRRSEDRFRRMSELLPISVIETDLLCNILFLNKKSQALFFYRRNKGKKVVKLFDLLDLKSIKNLKKDLKILKKKEKIMSIECMGQKGDGEFFPILLKINLIYRERKPMGFRFAITDITEIKKAEQKLADSYNKLKILSNVKDEFIAIASHELRTPMSVIKGYSSLMLNEEFGDINEMQKEMLKKIIGNSNRLIGLVNSMLDLNKFEFGKTDFDIQSVLVEKIVKEVVQDHKLIYKKKRIALSFTNMGDSPERVLVDHDKIKQVFINLLDNAFKFTSKGGKVEIIMKKYSKNGNFLKICVNDTGIGIAKKDKEKIFRKFSKADTYLSGDYEGSGLGLAIVKEIITGFGGKIWVESEEGIGSSFIFLLKIDKKNS